MSKLNDIIQKLNLLSLEKTTIYSGLFGYEGYNIKEYKYFYYKFDDEITINDLKIMLNLLLNIIFKNSNISIADKMIFRDVEYNIEDYKLDETYNLSNLYNFYDILDIINDAKIDNNILKMKIPIYTYIM